MTNNVMIDDIELAVSNDQSGVIIGEVLKLFIIDRSVTVMTK